MSCSVRDRFPSWRRSGPWPYELGIAALMLWLAESIRHIEEVRARYIVSFAMWDWVDDHLSICIAALWTIAFAIIAGFGLRNYCPRCAAIMRVLGVGASGAVCGVIAYHFLSAYPWSVGGGAYLFLSWRAFAVAAAVMHRHRRLFRVVFNPS